MRTIRARYEQIWPSGWQENVEIEVSVGENERAVPEEVIALLEQAAETMPNEGDPTQPYHQGVLFTADQLAELQGKNGQEHEGEGETVAAEQESGPVRS